MAPPTVQPKGHRSFAWLSLAGIFALLPKCVLCVGAYAGVGTWLGLRFGGREICSASSSSIDPSLAENFIFSVVAHDHATLGGMLISSGSAMLMLLLWRFRKKGNGCRPCSF